MKNWPFALWGGDGSDDEGGDDDESSEEDEPEVLTMTQTELEATINRAASRASRKARKDVRKSLGFESQEELDAFVTTTREAEDANKDEADKLKLENETARASLVSDRRTFREESVALAIERSIIMSGVTDEAKVKRIRTLVRSELGDDIDSETLADEVTDALDAVKTDIPSMFESTSKGSGGSGDGGAKNKVETDDEKRDVRLKQYADEYAAKGAVVTIPQ